jgi:hypothetical protein
MQIFATFFRDVVNWAANLFCPMLNVSLAISDTINLYGLTPLSLSPQNQNFGLGFLAAMPRPVMPAPCPAAACWLISPFAMSFV